MRVEIDPNSGFCFGVVKAISKAEELLSSAGEVYSLGDIVHNSIEIKRLENMGLRCTSEDRLLGLGGKQVLIRAHGAPPAVFEMAKKYGIILADATCPVVSSLQKLVIKADLEMQKVDGQVVILGKRGHAEVVGLNGQIDNRGIVIEDTDDLYKMVDFLRPIYLLSQTTKSLSLFETIKETIIKEIPQAIESGRVIIRDTICRQVSNRYAHLRDFAKKVDVIIFVSGKESSNGKALYENCLEVNPTSYKIEAAEELKSELFEGAKLVGICGATSTPKWQMSQIGEYIETRF